MSVQDVALASFLELFHTGDQVGINRQNRLGVGDVEEALHLIVGAGHPEVSSALSNLTEDMHDDPEAGAVHELHVGEVKHKLARALLNQ